MRKLTLLALLCLGPIAAGADRPNLILMMTDDQRYDYMGHAGHAFIKTPSMDRLAAEGVQGRNVFVTNSLCAPSRASIMTGLYSHSHGVIDNMGSKLRDDVTWLPDVLREAGYEVAFCGKSHVPGFFRNKTWDYYFGFPNQGRYLNPVIAEGTDGPDKAYEGYVDDIVTDHALKWIRKPRTKPYCLFLFFKGPHRAWQRPARHKDLYQDAEVKKPALWDDPGQGKPLSFLAAANMIGQYPDVKNFDKMIKDYCAVVTAADDNIGRVLDTLTELRQLDQTAIMHTSDNGFFLGEWQRFDKRFMHEASIRVPLLIRYPALAKPGTSIDPMILNIDIGPTLLDLAGVKAPAGVHGRSIVPLLKGDASTWRKDWLYEYFEFPDPSHHVRKHRGIRTEHHKFIHYYEPPFKTDREEFELYDLKNDPQERVNLYARMRDQPLVKELRERIEVLRKESGDVGK